jgi:DNA polymerase-3 subunit epsilon
VREANIKKILILDTETTGVNPQEDRIVELSMVFGFGARPITAPWRTWRFNPERPIPTEATAVHKITDEDVLDKPTFAECVTEILQHIRQADVLIGYNLAFDLQILDAEITRVSREFLNISGKLLVDPLQLWQKMEPRTLEGAYKRFVGSPLEGAHSSLNDADATGLVLDRMLEAFELEGASWTEVAKICDPSQETRVGFTDHLQRVGGEVVINFGKYKGRSLRRIAENGRGRNYLDWVLSQDFPRAVREEVERALQWTPDPDPTNGDRDFDFASEFRTEPT